MNKSRPTKQADKSRPTGRQNGIAAEIVGLKPLWNGRLRPTGRPTKHLVGHRAETRMDRAFEADIPPPLRGRCLPCRAAPPRWSIGQKIDHGLRSSSQVISLARARDGRLGCGAMDPRVPWAALAGSVVAATPRPTSEHLISNQQHRRATFPRGTSIYATANRAGRPPCPL